MSTSSVVSQITEALAPVLEENEQLREGIAEVRAMFAHEDAGWQLILGQAAGDRTKGLDLEEVQAVSATARTQVAAGALPKRAADLHAGYVFGGNLEIDETLRQPGKNGAPTNTVRFYENPVNQESLFSGAAKRELQYARFTDGNVVAFCDTSSKTVRRIPIFEIKQILVSPEYPDEIWAWMREWDQVGVDGKSETKRAWAYTNRFSGTRKQTIKVGQENVPVLKNVTAVDLRSNRQTGWVFGVPDAVAGLHWTRAYSEVLRYGQIVSESLAKFTYKVVQKTKQGAQNVGVKMSSGGVGQTAVVGEGQDIQLVSQSRQAYDFTHARPLAAMAAAAWNVTNPDLLADSSASGSSYGSLNALTPGMQNAMQAMRDEWTQFYQDIFQVMGFGRLGIHWPPMNEPDAYRLAQELTLYSPALSDEEYRAAVLDRLDIVGDAKVVPPSLKARNQAPKQAASPDQGRNSPAGGADSGSLNDQRSDGISEAMERFRQEEFLERLEAVAARIEAAKGA